MLNKKPIDPKSGMITNDFVDLLGYIDELYKF